MTKVPKILSDDLCVPSAAFPYELAVRGFLTPTPWMVSDDRVRVFGGMRNSAGVSRIGWADIDVASGQLLATCEEPVLDVGSEGDFDADGVILGDLFLDPITGDTAMVYVGFAKPPSVKFTARTGLAVLDRGGSQFIKTGPVHVLSGNPQEDFRRPIEAIHSVQASQSGRWEALVAVGTGWESIRGEIYPRYESFLAVGDSLLELELGPAPVVSLPPEEDVYRLGRPRFAGSVHGRRRIIATGMTREGIYGPYEFIESGPTSFVWSRQDPYDLRPGQSPSARRHAAYAVEIDLPTGEKWAFYNGDNMGRAGVRLRRLSSTGSVQQ
jgi:hypothetical protein